MMKTDVIAYSGYKANERPLCFVREGRKITVSKITDRWVGREHDYFRVIGEDGHSYLLKWHRSLDIWFCEKQESTGQSSEVYTQA